MHKVLVAFALVAGCGAPDLRSDRPLTDLLHQSLPKETSADPKELTLQEALALAESLNAGIRARKETVAAARGRLEQAKRWANPTLSLGREGITPSSERDQGGDQAQDLIGLSYPLSPGNPRGAAAARAEEELRLAEADLEIAGRELRVRVTQAFVDALFAREGLELSRKEHAIAQRFHGLVKTRWTAGDVAEREVIRADVEVGRSSIHMLNAEAARDHSLLVLSGAIGDRKLKIRDVKGELVLPAVDVTYDEVERRILEDSPLARRWAAQRAVALGRVREAQAAAWPVISLGAAYRRYRATDQDTWDVGLEMPLPIFDMNSGAIEATRAELSQIEHEILTEATRTLTDLSTSFRELQSIRDRLAVYQKTILPTAERSLELVSAAYQAREASTLELLDAERSIVEVRKEAIEASRAYHRGAAQIVQGFTTR